MSLLLKNGNALIDGQFRPADVLVEDGIIAGVGQLAGAGMDITGCTVVPGYIDAHIHGAGGFGVCDGPDALRGMSRALAAHGVTGFLPTLAAEDLETTRRTLEDIASLMAEGTPGAAVLGAHMEGPFMGPSMPGALNTANFLPPTVENWRKLTDGVEHVVRRVTLDPAVDGALEMVEYLTARGIGVSLGHSNVDADRALCAFHKGAITATHLYNAMPAMHHRSPGLVGAALSDPDVTVELIADLIHVNPVALRVAIATKGPERVLFISDAMEAAGMPDGDYNLGGLLVQVVDGVARVPAGNLAGSTLFLDQAVRNAVERLGVTPADAAIMAAVTPARVSREGHRRGAVAVGRVADLTVLDGALRPVITIVGGVIYQEKIKE